MNTKIVEKILFYKRTIEKWKEREPESKSQTYLCLSVKSRKVFYMKGESVSLLMSIKI